jgi:hypothetical protein
MDSGKIIALMVDAMMPLTYQPVCHERQPSV